MKFLKKFSLKKSVVPVFALSVALFGISIGLSSYVADQNNLRPGRAHAQGGGVSWGIFDGGADDPGSNYNESAISTSNVSSMAKLWSSTLPFDADDAVVEQANVTTSQGTMDLVFVNTEKGNLIAYNAWTGAKIWEVDPSSTNYNGQGTKSSPAVDPSGNYIYSYGLDGYIHKYNIATGAEVNGNGFPAQITLLANNIEKESASLNVGNGYLYATTSGNDGDYGHYVGHVVAINLSTGAKTVWNSECSNITTLEDATSGDANYCSNTQSGMWARPGVKVDPVTGNVFVASGNGLYDANSGGHDWGDSIIELTPNLSSIVDSYTPTTYASLQSGDADLGSTAPVILPTQSSSNTPYMLVQAGKDHIIRLLNRSNLSGSGAPGHTGGETQTITISDEVHEQPAVWVDGSGNAWVYVTDESGDFYAYKLVTTSGTSRLVQQYTENLGAKTSPFIANGVLYLDGPSSILAINPTTGATLFNSSSISVGVNMHWASPVLVNGILYTPDLSGHLVALYVPSATYIPTNGLVPATTYAYSLQGHDLYTDSTMSTEQNSTSLTPGQRYYAFVKVQNTSNYTWYQGQVNLGTWAPANRPSILKDWTWPSTQNNRAGVFQQASVAPGSTATYGFWIVAPSASSSIDWEHFNLVDANGNYFPDSSLYFGVRS